MIMQIIPGLSRHLFNGLKAIYFGGHPATLYDAAGNIILVGVPTPAPTMLVAPTVTPQAGTVGQPIALTLGQWHNSTALTGVLMQGGVDRSGEIVAGVWTPSQTGPFNWTVTATGPGGSTTAPVVSGTVSAAEPVPAAPTITRQPAITPAHPAVGDTITLSPGAASGVPEPAATWTLTRDGADITDQVEGMALTLAEPGTYVLTVTWTNSAGSASGTATARVESAPQDAPEIRIDYDPMQDADPVVTTDSAGTVYWAVTTSATAPTVAQMLAGTPADRVASGSAVTIPGPLNVDLGDLPAKEDSQYLWALVQRAADGAVSEVAGALLTIGTDAPYAGISSYTGDPVVSDYTDADGSWRCYQFLSPGEASITVSDPGLVEYLAVAGGGGGGGGNAYNRHGGGAAGEFKAGTLFMAPGSVAFTVGSGGAGSNDPSGNATNGTDTTFGGFTLLGGGHGGTRSEQRPGDGGSGGGAYALSQYTGRSLAVNGLGHDGARTFATSIGGCGGGAGGPAQNHVEDPFFPGAAGPGVESGITGTVVSYAAGGTGSGSPAAVPAVGGGAGAAEGNAAGTAGQTPGSGGGAGNGSGFGGNGADGAVILRIKIQGAF